MARKAEYPRVCAERSPDGGFLCTEPEDHEGEHVAGGLLHDEYARWPQGEREAVQDGDHYAGRDAR